MVLAGGGDRADGTKHKGTSSIFDGIDPQETDRDSGDIRCGIRWQTVNADDVRYWDLALKQAGRR